MSLPAPSPLGASEYLSLERGSEERYELVDGERLALAGASLNHVRIVGNVFDAVSRSQLPSPEGEGLGKRLKSPKDLAGMQATYSETLNRSSSWGSAP